MSNLAQNKTKHATLHAASVTWASLFTEDTETSHIPKNLSFISLKRGALFSVRLQHERSCVTRDAWRVMRDVQRAIRRFSRSFAPNCDGNRSTGTDNIELKPLVPCRRRGTNLTQSDV